ncbi:8462_t:CDS:1 [Racocetra fulgida]|uniref:8462_t:CDS:1 n=1 Tax=Racocetra fulgida TaxID=60492 RepID=A0A9N8ZER4_9GLOM|nr:8462_t:CDS:1 [Racocetra fulgida]
MLYKKLNEYGEKFDPNLSVEIIHKYNQTDNPTTSVQTVYLGPKNEAQKCLKNFIDESRPNPINDSSYRIVDWFVSITNNKTITDESKLYEYIEDEDKDERKPVKMKSFLLTLQGYLIKGLRAYSNL